MHCLSPNVENMVWDAASERTSAVDERIRRRIEGIGRGVARGGGARPTGDGSSSLHTALCLPAVIAMPVDADAVGGSVVVMLDATAASEGGVAGAG